MRIVSLAPVMTEILYALGAADDIVAVTRFCDWPPEARQKEKIGDWINSEPEKLNEYKPDLIFASYYMPESLRGWQGPGQLLHFEPRNLWEVFDSIRAIGEAVGINQRVTAVVEEMKNGFRKTRSSSRAHSVRVYMEEWFQPPLAAGNWVPELAAIAGGDVVISEVGRPSQPFSLAALVVADPDLIVCHWQGWGDRTDLRRIAERPGWQELRAVEDNRIFFVDDALINRPGPRLVEGALKLKEVFATAPLRR